MVYASKYVCVLFFTVSSILFGVSYFIIFHHLIILHHSKEMRNQVTSLKGTKTKRK